jgi:hypothetical protein
MSYLSANRGAQIDFQKNVMPEKFVGTLICSDGSQNNLAGHNVSLRKDAKP